MAALVIWAADSFISGLIYAIIGGLLGIVFVIIALVIYEALTRHNLQKEGGRPNREIEDYLPVKLLLKYGFVDHLPNSDMHRSWLSEEEKSMSIVISKELAELKKENEYIVSMNIGD
ncbi:MAG: hypothetical protein IJL56_09975 [Bacteroidales bacterium]|nr:hypothetical protein [Bacteroidales bacterium]